MQSFLPFTQASTSKPQEQTALITKNLPKTATTPTKQLPYLLALLTTDYQQQIAELHRLGVFEINLFINMTEQLIPIAQQYHCNSLENRAHNLKNQAQLFDLIELSKTLGSFEKLINPLQLK